MGCEALFEGCLGHLVVRLYLLWVLKRVSDHVETILTHAWLCLLSILHLRTWIVKHGSRSG